MKPIHFGRVLPLGSQWITPYVKKGLEGNNPPPCTIKDFEGSSYLIGDDLAIHNTLIRAMDASEEDNRASIEGIYRNFLTNA